MARLYYFGRLMDVAGCSEETVGLPEHVSDTDALRQWLEQERGWDGALQAPAIRVAVNDEIAAGAVAVKDADSIAFLPPVGGG